MVCRCGQGHPMDWLLLKISVLLANFCWLGDLGEIICPWKESVAGKSQFRTFRVSEEI